MEDLQLIDTLEQIREYLLSQEPGLEQVLRRKDQAAFRPRSEVELKMTFLAALLRIDPEVAAGKRKVRGLLAQLQEEHKNDGPESSKKIRDQQEDPYQQHPHRLLPSPQRLQPALSQLEQMADEQGELFQQLTGAASPLVAYQWLVKRLPLLQGLRGFQFLSLLDFPVVIPERRRQDLLFRLGLLSSRGHSLRVYKELFAIATRWADLCQFSLSSLDCLLGLYSGAVTFERKQLGICRATPRCNECAVKKLCHYVKYSTQAPRSERLPIKQWAISDRPREKMLSMGAEKMSTAELLSLIIGSGTREHSALELGKRLTHHFPTLEALDNASVGELAAIKGIGQARALEIKAALELGKRLCHTPLLARDAVSSSKDVFNHFKTRFTGLKQETFLVLLLDTKNRLIREVEISKGALNVSVVHPREVFKEAIKESTAAVIFVHNHPSGDPSPSSHDLELTRRLKAAAELLGIKVLDHVIMGRKRYYSCADEGVL